MLNNLQGLRVPEPLRKYLPGAPDFIPFSKELPKDTTSQKAKKGDKKSKVAAAADAVAEAEKKLKNVVVN
jgi:seryl-tRNA synthetase